MSYENYDPCFPDQPVVDQYLSVWAKLPAFRSKPAFIWAQDGSTRRTLTYEQLNNSVQSISSSLLLQLQRGDTVVILCSPGLELVEVIFGCQRAGLLGVPMVPPDPSFSNGNYHHLVRVLSQTKPQAAIASGSYIKHVHQYISSSSSNKKLCALLQNVMWISTDDVREKIAVAMQPASSTLSSYGGCKPDEMYLIQYTSGATAIPKPVLVTAGSAAHNVRAGRRAYDLHPNSVVVSWLPQYHDCGLMFLLLTIVSGATCVLTSPNAFIRRPRLWLELITEFKATCTPVPSFTLPLVVKRGGADKGTAPIDLWSMKNLVIINEPIYETAIQQFVEVFRPFGLNPESIAPSYGLAENCTFVSTAWRGDDAGYPIHKKLLPSARLATLDRQEGLDSFLRDDEDLEIMVVDEETHEAVEDGVEGEIWISSPSNASGYLGHPTLTREVFQGRLNNRVGRCFVRTGDRGIVKGEERYLFVTGRCSDLLRLESGREIHPHYIETAAYEFCPQLLRGGCLAAFEVSEDHTIAIVAEMQRIEGEIWVLRKVCEGIREAIFKEEKIEVGMVVLVTSGNIPKTTSGKIQRWAAKDKFSGGKMDVLMKMQFGDESKSLGKKVVNEDSGAFLSTFSNAPTFLPLNSSL